MNWEIAFYFSVGTNVVFLILIYYAFRAYAALIRERDGIIERSQQAVALATISSLKLQDGADKPK